ncbi:MAG: hypothetical protein QMB11_07440 [Nonlabens sp.]|uniref:beta strand repeat-containing protein n=1 Tax=Nonlabens sp. TaxID=1888209 RepID=UPI0035A5D28C
MIGIKEIVGVGCCVLFSHVGFSQVKMNTNFATGNMNSNTAFLDGSSSNSWNRSSNLGKGLLFPRVDLTTLAAMSMAGSPSASNNPNRFDGMLVYNTGVGTSAIGSVSVTAGFYYYKNSTADIDGGTWQPMSAMDLAGDISSVGGVTTIGDGKVTDDKVASGISASKVGLGNVDNTTDANKPVSGATQSALGSKADLASPSFTGTPSAATAAALTNTTQLATTAFVTGAVSSSSIASATTSTEGKIQLAGDLSGTAALPVIGADKITTDKIADGTILGADLSDGAIDLAANTVSGVLSTTKGGTGAGPLTGFIKGNGAAAFTTVSSIDIAAVTGAVSSVNGSIPDANGNVIVSFGSVKTGSLSAIPAQGSTVSGNIYVVSGDGANNGQTFINDGANWNQITSDQSATDSRYVKLEGGIMQGNLTFPAGKMATVADAPQGSTDIANKKYVDETIIAGTPDATSASKGKIQLAGDLAGTAVAPTVPGLLLKANNASPAFTGTPTAPTALFGDNGSSLATTGFVASAISSSTIASATSSTEGKIQLAGDLAGTAALPVIAANKITTDKIADGTILSSDLSDGAIDLSTATVSGVLSTTKGGTGAASLTGFIKGNGTAAFTTVSSIDIAAVTGAVSSVNGSIPDANGNVTIAFGSVRTGTLSAIPAQGSAVSGNIYVVSDDSANNGQTFINDGANWNQITSDQAATDNRYVKLEGGMMQGNLTFPTGKMAYVVDAPQGSTDIANKQYVDAAVVAGTPDATLSANGKIRLAGDLAGTAIAPTVPGLLNKADIASPSFTGTVSGITASMVGLANVDNTTDLLKPISNATQTALDDKEATANKSTDINADADSDVKFPSVKAVKTYVDASSSSIKEVRTITTSGTAASTDYILLCNTSGGAFGLNLPAASSQKGKIYIIRKTDVSSNALTISPSLTLGSEEVTAVNYPTTIEVVSDGTNWNVLN